MKNSVEYQYQYVSACFDYFYLHIISSNLYYIAPWRGKMSLSVLVCCVFYALRKENCTFSSFGLCVFLISRGGNVQENVRCLQQIISKVYKGSKNPLSVETDCWYPWRQTVPGATTWHWEDAVKVSNLSHTCQEDTCHLYIPCRSGFV